MTLKDMDYILELAQTQNFNRAAENLYSAQPTLSYHILISKSDDPLAKKELVTADDLTGRTLMVGGGSLK